MAAKPRYGFADVVDDASGDPEIAGLDEVAGLRLVRNPRNLGFIRACNAAAPMARGAFLLFLNNDTQVMPGAIDMLVAALDADATIGAAYAD